MGGGGGIATGYTIAAEHNKTLVSVPHPCRNTHNS